MAALRLDEYRPAGTRNYIRVGDTVRCDPPAGRPFIGKVMGIRALADNVDPDAVADLTTVAVDLCMTKKLNGNDHPQRGMARTVHASRLTRVAQTKHKETR